MGYLVRAGSQTRQADLRADCRRIAGGLQADLQAYKLVRIRTVFLLLDCEMDK